ncbi:unnamed protein product [Angiostrongylus costaricensis]|uniref:Mediator of RNA polymerase II transcription subunit 29 n=1 Tax=Angiostrongylus costaricensis TaxID=334426 RepID=A0A0R3PNX9_ANGCS|nr:unnamed protein product [Angiostrongylus costaricensis]
MMFNQQHMIGRQMGQMGVQRQMYTQDSGMSQQSQMQMHFSQQQQMQQMSQQQMSQMPQLQLQQQQQPSVGHQQQMQMGMQQHLSGQQMGIQQQQQQQQQQQMVQQQSIQQHMQQTQQMSQQQMHSGQTQQQLTPGGGPGSQPPGSTLAVASAGGPTSVGPMSVQPHTPMNPSSQQAIAQPSSVQPGPPSVAPGTPASNQPPPQAPTMGEPADLYLQDPVAHSKQLIMKDLRFCIVDLNRRAGEALKDLKAGNVPSNSNEYLKAMDNLFAVCDEIEGNLVLVCETQKQMSRMEKIFDKDAMKFGEQHPNYSDSKARNVGSEDDSTAYFSAVNTYIDQTRQLQAAFDRAFSHVGRTLETIRRRQNMSSNAEQVVKMEE